VRDNFRGKGSPAESDRFGPKMC